MRKSLFTLAGCAALCASPALAQEYAQTAADIGNAIQNGSSEGQRALLPQLTDVEFAELERLKGCEAAINPGGGKRLVIVDWTCGDNSSDPGLARSTAMLFAEDGALRGFAINRLFGLTEVDAESGGFAEPVQTAALLRRIGEAVTSQGDPGLGGLIPLDDFDRARLAPFSEGSYRVSRRRVQRDYRITFYEGTHRRTPRRTALLKFDEEGQPVGLIFTPTYVARDQARLQYGRNFETGSENRRVRPVQSGCVIC